LVLTLGTRLGVYEVTAKEYVPVIGGRTLMTFRLRD